MKPMNGRIFRTSKDGRDLTLIRIMDGIVEVYQRYGRFWMNVETRLSNRVWRDIEKYGFEYVPLSELEKYGISNIINYVDVNEYVADLRSSEKENLVLVDAEIDAALSKKEAITLKLKLDAMDALDNYFQEKQ